MTTLQIITQITADKKARNREPTHALYIDVLREASKYYPLCTKEIVDAELSELQSQGKIRIGPTINDFYITLYLNENEN